MNTNPILIIGTGTVLTDPVHLHLLLNHLPVVGTAFTLVLLLVAFAKNNAELKRVGLAFLVLIALLAVAVYLTGKSAEESVMQMEGFEESIIERHAGAAQWAFGAQVVLGVFALGGLFLSRRGQPLPKWCMALLLVLTLAVGGLMARTANLGGEIRHPEIRASQAPAAAAQPHGE